MQKSNLNEMKSNAAADCNGSNMPQCGVLYKVMTKESKKYTFKAQVEHGILKSSHSRLHQPL